MGPATQQFHAKQEQHDYDQTPPPLNNIHNNNKDSNFISRLPPSTATASSTTTTTAADKQPPRRPVIIYTHSPKVIHTHPRDFMALVQKLTGYTPPPEETTQASATTATTQDRRGHHQRTTEDNESTSVVTEEHGSSVNDIPQVNSCFVDGGGGGVGVGVGVAPPPYRSAVFDPYFNPTPVFPANPTEFLCAPSHHHHHQLPFYNPDSLFMNRNSLSSSSSTLRALKEYPDI